MCFFKVNYTIKHLPHGDYTLIIGDKTYKQHVSKLSTQLSFGPDRDTVLVVRQPNPIDTTIVYLEADTYPSFPGRKKQKKNILQIISNVNIITNYVMRLYQQSLNATEVYLTLK